MSKVRVYIVEDEPLIAATIQSSLEKEGFEIVGHADEIGKAFFEIDELQPDFVFLDIYLKDGNHGIKLGKKLSEKTNIPFIFLTSYHDSATVAEANATNPAGYLLKPFKSKDLKVAIDIAMTKRQETNENAASDSVFVKMNKKWQRVNFSDIQIIKADDTYSEIYTKDGKHLVSSNLKKVEEKLPSDKFTRVHRSYIVNLDFIDGIDEDTLIVQGELIPISRSYKQDVLGKLNFL